MTLIARRTLIGLAATALAAASGLATAQGSKEIRIAHVYSKTGPLEAYGKQTQIGLMMGLEYATGGTMTVAGRKLVVIEKDDQGKPDVGKSLLAAAYGDDKADIAVGPSSSGVALAMLPVAEEYKKILLVEPAVADSITGEKWNKYIFRTGRNSSQDAISNAVALDQEGTVIATLAQDYAFGRDGVAAFKSALKKAKVVHEEYLPTNTTDFTAGAQRLFDALKDKPGRKVIFIIWAGAGNPFKIADLDPKRYGIEIATGGNILPAMVSYKQFPGMEGATYYYFGIPKNPVNEWLVANHYSRYKSPPDFFTAGGMAAGMAIVEALKKTNGDTNTNKLIKAMEGMRFQTPKGEMYFRPEDHQAMQSMYHFRIKVDPAFEWGVPELVREIRPEEMDVPIRNKR
ncbi:substrate-binding domain-containing protein [Caldimonas thermodepolymerans]|jgi:ABC-type branched-chain amino acid transport systems, periplasmic component|uniref:ABC transporter permease n=1 Tax=Caldimonas thermodepolymerans TaxID=215580 RepID=A0A2S5T382_9BURK|nr:substrate-binding domain-containing protein [Caldimonas thermodepolymerans]PPE69337.1 ABC transporter permease [Caldimonas thermodepolymerans]QPC31064.1 substrate-binding domain-containing protein [Caldimonas thermodepolymerans]RDH96208.1 amino acid/amide ABC transporter substrate-binding protein (HAAT family) [Caldimonas thermodepolymerans]TCP04128.1 amino acid/amide ABC transporter substrate-binding protein (HAAT family) [Caldimonas thermodepolymerans]UZG47456.1 substrate-binding domain-c